MDFRGGITYQTAICVQFPSDEELRDPEEVEQRLVDAGIAPDGSQTLDRSNFGLSNDLERESMSRHERIQADLADELNWIHFRQFVEAAWDLVAFRKRVAADHIEGRVDFNEKSGEAGKTNLIAKVKDWRRKGSRLNWADQLFEINFIFQLPEDPERPGYPVVPMHLRNLTTQIRWSLHRKMDRLKINLRLRRLQRRQSKQQAQRGW